MDEDDYFEQFEDLNFDGDSPGLKRKSLEDILTDNDLFINSRSSELRLLKEIKDDIGCESI